MTPFVSIAPPKQSRPVPRRAPALLALMVVCAVAVFGWRVINQSGYTPGSRAGYDLGLTGAVMMLVLFLYPLRKHLRWLRTAGPLREWLNLHMLLGICGPLLILFHSRFQIGSVNATVAMASMLIVAGSGIVGRFIYTRVHHTLHGRKLAAKELRTALAESLEAIQGGRALPLSAKSVLEAYEARVNRPATGAVGRALKFFTIGWRRKQAASAIHHALRREAGGKRLAAQIDEYLVGLQRVAQFSVYERLFSLWHVLHIPFVALLVVSAVYHVVAVHMY
jgi:hypothetical protein